MSQYYNHKKQDYFCQKCGWAGTGEQTEEIEIHSDWMEIGCPKCYNLIGALSFPTIDEILKYGTDEEKAQARKKRQFIDRVMDLRLKCQEQLPEIESDEIIITLREEVSADDGKDGFIVLYCKGNEIWREIRTYEYWDRYIELGKILKEKYGDRLKDFEAELTTYLGGDYTPSFGKVREFRNSLQN